MSLVYILKRRNKRTVHFKNPIWLQNSLPVVLTASALFLPVCNKMTTDCTWNEHPFFSKYYWISSQKLPFSLFHCRVWNKQGYIQPLAHWLRHHLWESVWIVTAVFPIHLSANAPRKFSRRWPKYLVLSSHVGYINWVLDSRLGLALPWTPGCCDHLGYNFEDGKVYLSLSSCHADYKSKF